VGNFTRTWRLIERLFPGSQEVPSFVGTAIQPVWDTMGLRVGETLLRRQRLTLAAVGSGFDDVTFQGPAPGRAQVPASISGFTSDPLGCAVTLMIVLNSTPPDAWGRWEDGLLETRTTLPLLAGGSAAVLRFPGAPPIFQGNSLQLRFHGVVPPGTLFGEYFYFDVPAELVTLVP
jgi:hypothetical protein